mmetsp:Transcript_20048/g.28054  ORF Transcript_20048/g.28054 Transcript_20048/m.28054 type:complete len:475 (+) Transcript_20048:107-1531(+)
MSSASSLLALRDKFEKAGQGHVFQFVDQLNDDEKNQLYRDLHQVDLEKIAHIHSRVQLSSKSKPELSPFPSVFPVEGSQNQRKQWESIGKEKISQGKVGVLLLAGGQGTRLGTTLPKGMYNIGLPSGKSLFQMQAERLYRLQQLINKEKSCVTHIPWYIMTSEATKHETDQYFSQNNYFGLDKNDIFIFEQQMLPCMTPEGKLILESTSKLAKAPNGNGALYEAMHISGALADMRRRGVEVIFQYCVDNSLVKMADPVFIGFVFAQGADCAAKVLPKLHAKEPVGVLALKNGRPGVVEYSEIDEQTACLLDPKTNKLVYNASHICMNAFSVNFISRVVETKLGELPYHIAKKKIPTVNEKGERTTIDGWKLELFIFDVFEFAENMVALEVAREQEFSPLKNGIGAGSDCPETCRKHISDLHKSLVSACGGKMVSQDPEALCEISPLISCSPEDTDVLREKVSGVTLSLPLEIKI